MRTPTYTFGYCEVLPNTSNVAVRSPVISAQITVAHETLAAGLIDRYSMVCSIVGLHHALACRINDAAGH